MKTLELVAECQCGKADRPSSITAVIPRFDEMSVEEKQAMYELRLGQHLGHYSRMYNCTDPRGRVVVDGAIVMTY